MLCSAGCCTQSSVTWGESRAHPQPALRVLLGQALAQMSTDPPCSLGRTQAFVPMGFPFLTLLPRGTEARAAVQANPSSRLASSTFKARRGRCCLGFALNCLLFLLICQKTLPRYLRMQQKCLLFLDLTSVLSSCKLQEGWATQCVHYLLKRLFIIAVPT